MEASCWLGEGPLAFATLELLLGWEWEFKKKVRTQLRSNSCYVTIKYPTILFY